MARTRVIISVGLALAVILSGCTGSPRRSAPDEPTAAAEGSEVPVTHLPGAASITPHMPEYLATANEANERTENTVVAVEARPTVVSQDRQAVAMTIRDEGIGDDWTAGNYRLVVYCSGSGTLFAHFRLGETSHLEELPPCGTPITTNAVDLHLAQDAKGSAVIIIPAGNVQAAVAYQIQRM